MPQPEDELHRLKEQAKGREPMARTLAGDVIQQLYQRGMTTAQISKALGGYDPAILGRVARGERPGTNLVGPLKGLLGEPPVAPSPRRNIRNI